MKDVQLISVIVTAYNVEEYIENCLHSVINQSYTDLEIIVVDDGSTDNTATCIKELCKEDNRITYIYQKNAGVSVARNVGIIAAKGSFVMFVDGDDCLESSIVEKLYAHIEDKTDIVACCCVGFDADNSYVEHFFDKSYIMETVNEKEKLYLQLMKTESQQPQNQKIFTAIGVPWGKLYRKQLLEDNDLKFNPNLRRMQDNVFNMYAFQCARQIKYIDEPLYRYRIDHIVGYTKRYNPDAYYNVLSERTNFMNTYIDYQTENLYVAYVNECADYYMASVKNICMTNSMKLAYSKINELNQKSIYKDVIISNTNVVSKKLKLTLKLERVRMIAVLYLYFKIRK